MANLITHNTRVTDGEGQSHPVQAYATAQDKVALDMNGLLTEDGAPFYELPIRDAVVIVKILEASIRDAQAGVFA